jgi:hypothetical protein
LRTHTYHIALAQIYFFILYFSSYFTAQKINYINVMKSINQSINQSYTWVFWRGLGSKGILDHRVQKALDKVFGHPVTCTWTLTGFQQSKLLKAQCHASAISLAHSNALADGAVDFFINNTPTMGDLVDYSQKVWTCLPKKRINLPHSASTARANLQARASVFHKYAALETNKG